MTNQKIYQKFKRMERIGFEFEFQVYKNAGFSKNRGDNS